MKMIYKKLEELTFKNEGRVNNRMMFEYRSRPCHYMEDVDQWATRYGGAYYNYLYQIEDGKEITPPSGIRSSVPLGGIGAGTFEMRADGSFKDFTIFNNSPAGGLKKQIDEMMFSIWTKKDEEAPVFKTLRTHPPCNLPSISSVVYRGAYPVSKIEYYDDLVPVDIKLHAFSPFHIYDEEKSASPSVVFNYTLKNRTDKEIETALLFSMPNMIFGEFSIEDNILILSKDGEESDSGEMAVCAFGEDMEVTFAKAESLYGIVRDYSAYGEFMSYMTKEQKENPIDGAVGRMYYVKRKKKIAAINAKVKLKPNETKEVRFILSWYFPFRTHASEVLMNYYTNLYKNAKDVLMSTSGSIEEIVADIKKWNLLCFDNSLPNWLQDAMVNSVGTIAKTGMWFKDGRFRQWESFSCPAVDPIHIHFYRVLPYSWFFKNFRRSIMKGFVSCQRDDGYIQENLGRAVDVLDKSIGRMLGDSCTTFILEVYQDYLWTSDKEFFDEMWPAAKRAALFEIERAKKYGLPNRMNNSYDWWEFQNKDLVSYNGVLYLASLLAVEKMAEYKKDETLKLMCQDAIDKGRLAMKEYLFNGSYYIAWKNVNEKKQLNTLLSDTLYGQLWAQILGLGNTLDRGSMQSHLESEMNINKSQYGLKVMYEEGRESDALSDMLFRINKEKPRDEIVWEAGSLDYCALNIYFDKDVEENLNEAKKIFDKWQLKLNDQWDIRDLSTSWNGEPYCNSHYARQLILFAIPLAITNQQINEIEGEITFDLKHKGYLKLPFMTSKACGIIEKINDDDYRVCIIKGDLEEDEIYINNKLVTDIVIYEEG